MSKPNKVKYCNKELKKIFGYSNHYTFFFGERGIGKTYWFKIKALKYAVKGCSTMFIRRTRNEAINLVRNFTLDIPAETLKKLGVDTVSRKGEVIYINGKPTIAVFGLTQEATARGLTAFPNPKFIYFDEINELQGKFLHDEPALLASFTESFFRKHKVKVFMTSNYTVPANPFFAKYNINSIKNLYLNGPKVGVYILNTKSPSYLSKKGLNIEKYLHNTALVSTENVARAPELFTIKYFNNLYKVVKTAKYYLIKRTFKLPNSKIFSIFGNDGYPKFDKSIGWFLPDFKISVVLGLVRFASENELFLLGCL